VKSISFFFGALTSDLIKELLLWGFNIRLDQRASSSVLKAQQPRAAEQL
jgi:hypothetical protein